MDDAADPGSGPRWEGEGKVVLPDQVAPPPPGRLRRAGKRALRLAVDRGLIGERLRAHVVVCGFPRSGSTLLQQMVLAGVRGVDAWTTEVEARWAAEHANRRRPWLLTKRPEDVDHVDDVRDWYVANPGRALVLLTTRDARDVLTSRHAGYPPERGYYCSTRRWSQTDARVRSLRRDDDVHEVRYEHLVDDPDAVGERLADAVGWDVVVPFGRWHEAAQESSLDRMTRGALGGVRPVERSRVQRWRAPEHTARLRHVLAELPQLPRRLVEEGHEPDESWADAYR